jgi:glucokinase
MMSPAESGVLPWLLVEASREGVLRFATAAPSARPRVSDIHEIMVAGVPTFTDALQQFEREKGIPLRGLQCAMAIAGAANGETISLVRSRWTISRAGLRAVFGTDAVILNDVAARAWGARSGTANVQQLRGVGTLNLARPGRYGMIMVEEGVGAAIVDVDRNSRIRVLETEAGHMDFSPTNDHEQRLANAIRTKVSGAVSWEMILMLDRNDPVWNHAFPDTPETERPRLQAALLGRFAINLMHAFGAWQGIMMTGSRAGRTLETGQRVHFDSPFSARRNFSRLVVSAPVWRVDQHEAVLTGAAERLASSLQPAIAAAA